MDDKELFAFGEYLSGTKRLGSRTLSLYLNYYRMIDLDLLPQQEYVNAFIQDHKNNSVVRAMMLNLLKWKGLNKTIEMPDRATGTLKKRLARPISIEEIKALSKALHTHSFKQGLIFDLIYQGALRRVEIPTIRINSFQWIAWLSDPTKHCKLNVIGKGDKERTVLINPQTAQSIVQFYADKKNWDFPEFANKQDLLFSTASGDQLTEKIVYDIVKKGSMKYLGRDIRTHELRHCLKENCEVLTFDGWKKWNDLQMGMSVFSYNLENDCFEKDIIKNIFVYDFHGELNYFKNLWLNYGFTDEHKHILKVLKGKKIKSRNLDVLNIINKDYWENYQRLTLDELKNKTYKRSIKHKLSSKYDGEISIGKEKAGILGFILTDATISKRDNPSIAICQSESANLEKCKYIEKLLIDGNIYFTKTINKYKIINFQILKVGNHSKNPEKMGKNHDWIYEFIEKDRTPKWKLLNLKYEELEELYKCMMMGDGTRGQEFCNQNIKRIEFFRVLCYLLNRNTTIGRKIQNGKKYYRTYIQRKNEVQIQDKHISKEEYFGKVFCIETKNNSFIAKSNEKLFTTGNSRATELERQGISTKDIKNYLGHSSIATTEIYLHRSEAESLDAIQNNLNKNP